jgi:hypothetical protein
VSGFSEAIDQVDTIAISVTMLGKIFTFMMRQFSHFWSGSVQVRLYLGDKTDVCQEKLFSLAGQGRDKELVRERRNWVRQ